MRAVLFAVATLAASVAQARMLDSAGLKTMCAGSSGELPAYVTGVVDASAFAKGVVPDQLAGLCVPADVTSAKLADLACAYLRDLPEKARLPAAALVFGAVETAFPCWEP